MTPVHASLRVRTNAVLLTIWTVGALLALAAAPRSVLFWVPGMLASGVIAGLLQARSVRQASALLRAATSAMEVRRAMVTTAPGRAYLKVFWVYAVAMVLAPIALGFTRGDAFAGATQAVAGYFVFAAVREALTIGACAALGREP